MNASPPSARPGRLPAWPTWGRRLGVLLGAGLLLAAGGCEVIKDPVVRVDLKATKTTISPGEAVQITATVTEDGVPLPGEVVTFSVAPVGDFPGGNQKTTDAVGQAATQLLVDPDDVTGDTIAVVTAAIQMPPATGTLDIQVDVTAGGGTR